MPSKKPDSAQPLFSFLTAEHQKLVKLQVGVKPAIASGLSNTATASVADLYYTVKNARLAKDKEAEALKALESAAENWLIDKLPANNATGIAGHLARVAVVTETIYTITDWDAFYEHIAKNRAKGGFALLQRRASTAALKEVAESMGSKCKFAQPVITKKLSVNKL